MNFSEKLQAANFLSSLRNALPSWKVAVASAVVGGVLGIVAGRFIDAIASHYVFWAIGTAIALTAVVAVRSNFKAGKAMLAALVGGAVLGGVGSVLIAFFATPPLMLLVGVATGVLAVPFFKVKFSKSK